ncbi:MAG: hypothetical protein ACFUZC_08530 [Chthoniobacteraceae bacterium]
MRRWEGFLSNRILHMQTNNDTPILTWLGEAGWGLMFHYIDKPASSNVASLTTPEEWNRRVDSFDVPRFVRAVKETRAGYVIFTIGQNTGHFCSPNAVYDGITGIRPSKLSWRDLIAEVAEALLPEVRLIAYLPSFAPASDAVAVERFRLVPPWDCSASGLPPNPDGVALADEKLSEFQRKWEAVVAEWGARWGKRVAGWWIDGCYFSEKMYGGEEPNGDSFARALRSGNPDRILAFNTGTATPFKRVTGEQDYTAGEVSNKFPVPNKWEPLSSEIDGMQTHILSYLGDWWGEGEPRFEAIWIKSYTRLVNRVGGAMTWDVPIGADGAIPSVFLDQLAQLSEN